MTWGTIDETKFSRSDPAAFGYSVAVSGTTAVVGSLYNNDNGTNSGSAYIYTEAEVIPLPAGVWLLGSALAMLALGRRFRTTGA